MDNVTHTLIGAVAGGWVAAGTQRSKRAVIAASVLASNIPDADVLFARFLSPPMGYLLHHRGHSHTVLGALLCGLLAWGIVWAVCRMKSHNVCAADHRQLAGISLLGAFLHLGLDALNTYGVHPFWPVNNSWYFGDTVFIVEPLLWISLALAVRRSPELRSAHRIARWIIAAGAGLILFSGLVPPKLIALYFLLSVGLGLGERRISSSFRIRYWVFASLSVIGVFLITGRLAAGLNSRGPSEAGILTTFIGPSPADPLCWSRLQLRKTSEAIVYEQEFLQPLGSLLPVDCARYSLFRSAENVSLPTVRWEIPLRAFREVSENCRWLAFLRFSRIPAIQADNGAEQAAFDIRFSKGGRDEFSTVPLAGSCPTLLPPWKAPIDAAELN